MNTSDFLNHIKSIYPTIVLPNGKLNTSLTGNTNIRCIGENSYVLSTYLDYKFVSYIIYIREIKEKYHICDIVIEYDQMTFDFVNQKIYILSNDSILYEGGTL